jgi:hypothetical protein
VIRYWEKGMAAAKHPLLRARYADLVWDLCKPACGLKPPVEAARTALDSSVAAGALADKKSVRPAADRLQRGPMLALSISDQVRAEQVRDALVDLLVLQPRLPSARRSARRNPWPSSGPVVLPP